MGTECNSALSITRVFLYPSDLGGAVIQEGVWDQAGPNNVQAIRFSSYGSIIGALYFKK